MADSKTSRSGGRQGIGRFLREYVTPLSEAFAQTPLHELRVTTEQGSVTLVKRAPAQVAASIEATSSAATASAETARPSADGMRAFGGRTASLVPAVNGEAGRTYVTINAEVVGIFRNAAPPPAAGDALQAGQVLGYIEALRLRNEVRCPDDATLVAQVVLDGQPVDYGEALFVIDVTQARAAAGPSAELPPDAHALPAADVQLAEPPRL
jgi:acetyl-CoA carboxylase biotin carboxyl carrier protein